jgi:FixJ family two-component response regulator
MTTPGQPWVIVVDDDTAVRIALQQLLTAAGLRATSLPSADALLRDPRLHLAGCLVLDLQMPGSSGLDIQAALESASVDVPIVFLTAHGSVGASVQAMKHGAADFLEKPVDPPILIEAVRQAIGRGADVRERRKRAAAYQARLGRLSAREREVLAGIVQGRLNKQIADDLAIAERTVKFHRARIMEKMEAGSVAELARMMEQLDSRSLPGA